MGGSGKGVGEIVTREERVPMTRDSSSVITKGILAGGEKDGTKRRTTTGKTAPRLGREGGKAKRSVNNGHGTRAKRYMYTYNREIYVYIHTYVYVYTCMCMYVYVYILLNGVNAYLTFGTGFSFFHFSPLFDCLFFRLSFFAVPFFRGTPCQRVPRDTIRVYTLAHAMLFMCIRDRLFRTTVAGGQKGNRETTALPIAGQ